MAVSSCNPYFASDNIGYELLADIKHGGQVSLTNIAPSVSLANLIGDAWVQFMFGVTVLANHVGHVLGLCPEKQMTRIDTKHSVACVAHFHSSGDRSIAEFPGNSVSKVSTWKSTVLTYLGAGPQPASIRLANSVPEALHYSSLGGNYDVVNGHAFV